MNVIVHGQEHACARAVKGANFIRLYDAAGNATIAFIGISDFSDYSISGGEWEALAPTAGVRLEEAKDTLDKHAKKVKPNGKL